jgi:integrase/recombinase XerD
MWSVAAVTDDTVREPRFEVRRVLLGDGGESWTVVGPGFEPVEALDRYLTWLTPLRSPRTVEGYARDLRWFWCFLAQRELDWSRVGVQELGEFAAWLRQPATNVVALGPDATARRAPATVNRMLSAVVGFYEHQARHGNELARRLVDRTRGGRGPYKPFLHDLAPASRRGRIVRLREHEKLPRVLSLSQLAAVIEAQSRLRDRFLFALLAGTGMRIGQALGLRHEDVVSWERRIELVPREDNVNRARGKGGRGSVPISAELVRLWSDYMHEEYGELESDYVFVNLWGGRVGRPMSYATVDAIVERTRAKVGFHFTPHQFRHTYATLAYRGGVQLAVVSALLTHRSPQSTLIYTHATAEDLRDALADAGVLEKVGDLV